MQLNINLNKVINLIELDIKNLLTQLVGKSNLVNDANIKVNNNSLELFLNDYIKYIESGRRPKAKKIPISVLSNWSKRKGIGLSNSELFAVQNSIFIKGIVGKPNLTKRVEEQFQESFEKYYKQILEPSIEQQIDLIIKNNIPKS